MKKAEQNRIRQERACLLAQRRVLDTLRSVIWRQERELRNLCSHPIGAVEWRESVPGGFARGTCSLCGQYRDSLDYSERLRAQLRFEVNPA